MQPSPDQKNVAQAVARPLSPASAPPAASPAASIPRVPHLTRRSGLEALDPQPSPPAEEPVFEDVFAQQLRANSDLFDAESDLSGPEPEEDGEEEGSAQSPVAGPETADGKKPAKPKPKQPKKVRDKTDKQRAREQDELRQQSARMLREDNSLR